MIKSLSLLLLVGCFSAMMTSHAQAEQDELPAQELTLYVGTYTGKGQGGILATRFNSQTGELSPPQIGASTPNASFLAASPDGRFLYAANEWGPVAGENKGGLSAFRIEPTTNELSLLGSVPMGGGLCHISVDASGKWLLAAGYGSGAVSTWPIGPDGSLGKNPALLQYTGSGPNANRQEAPHAHQIVLSSDNRRAYAVDLGTDKVMVHDFDVRTGALTHAATPFIPFIPVTPGAGPRHLAFNRSGQFLYVVSELNNTVTVFKDASTQSPLQIQTISTLPADFTDKSSAAEIALSPDGRFLYVSNRGYNSIAHYAVEADGQLKLIGFTPTGRNPRHFSFDPSGKWLLVANQNDRSISVLRVDPQTGALTPTQQLTVPDEPVCLLFGKS